MAKDDKTATMKLYAEKIQTLPANLFDEFQIMVREYYFELIAGRLKLNDNYIDELKGVKNGRSIRYWLWDLCEKFEAKKVIEAGRKGQSEVYRQHEFEKRLGIKDDILEFFN